MLATLAPHGFDAPPPEFSDANDSDDSDDSDDSGVVSTHVTTTTTTTTKSTLRASAAAFVPCYVVAPRNEAVTETEEYDALCAQADAARAEITACMHHIRRLNRRIAQKRLDDARTGADRRSVELYEAEVARIRAVLTAQRHPKSYGHLWSSGTRET
jgi:hypothetical protein